MRLFFFLMFCAIHCCAQQVDFEGFVKDKKTKSPIPYVNISFLNTLKGTSTDEQGRFELEVPKSFLDKNIHVSSLGYKDTILKAKTVFGEKLLLLRENTFELDEVVVSENFGDFQVLNPISENQVTSGFDSSSTPWVLATYFPNIGEKRKYIEKVVVFLGGPNQWAPDKSKFRIRFYGVQQDIGYPSMDLVKESILVECGREEPYVSVDVSHLKLRIPREGIYVGLEWLFVPFNWYKKDEKDNLTQKLRFEDRFAPTFGGMYTRNQNLRVMIYGMGEWREFLVKSKTGEEKLIPAISLRTAQNK